MTELRVRKPDGWTTVSFPEEVGTISVAGGKVDGQLCLTLTGEREGGPGIVETVFLMSPRKRPVPPSVGQRPLEQSFRHCMVGCIKPAVPVDRHPSSVGVAVTTKGSAFKPVASGLSSSDSVMCIAVSSMKSRHPSDTSSSSGLT